ncbi:hypothetical protein GMORB2_3707 [Geosmithia morbida]|uniref:Uncharacterized protein n=1 Tax=Geosmithia morbida TaxID=1094350 RepID=A0A9P4YXF6_9HYPO|nr:uncharacterized protein GMORB2_3707 [Geosmithia morbida]KAF4124868.1 hypothetical protein GMORB2_3707 [Geosmithia morbida]
MSTDTSTTPPHREMKIVGSGTATHRNVYHTSQMVDRPQDWLLLKCTADATFPCLETHAPDRPITHADWDELWGRYEASTDAASVFDPELIAAYPDARVVPVER